MKDRESEWGTENLIVECLQWLHTKIADRLPCILILDVYPAHQTDVVVDAVEECDIELLFISASGTNKYQPLDYRIFGELKSRSREEIVRLISRRGGIGIEHEQSVTISERCWNAIPGENIRKAWVWPGLGQSSMRQSNCNGTGSS
jgi:hypothetical protein